MNRCVAYPANLLLAVIILSSTSLPAWGCDPCALFNTSKLHGHSEGAFTISVSEQYTDYDQAADIPENSIRNGELVKGYSTTQFGFAYDFTKEFGMQLTLPLIARRFDKIETFRKSSESDAGIGDLSLIGTYSFCNFRSADWAIIAGAIAGVKFPTGDTGTLEDFANETEEAGGERMFSKHHSIGSASGGRALTFGSGSYDYITGLSFLARYQRFLLVSSAQYTIRTEGDFNYEFDDDLLWSVGPAYYFLLNHESSLAGGVVLSGEYKGSDRLDGEAVEGSKVSNLYLGPQLLFAFSNNLSGELTLDFRVTGEDKDATVVPESRVRASLSYRFS